MACGRLLPRSARIFADLAQSREISYAEWKARSLIERRPELLGWILERQQ
jgi:hypothetical protein